MSPSPPSRRLLPFSAPSCLAFLSYMAPSSPSIPLVLFVSAFVLLFSAGRAAIFSFVVHHRFSSPVRRWAELSGRDLPGGWPEKGSVEYYAALAGHDLSRSFAISDAANPADLTFSEGNVTIRISSLGFLHYALVTIGTPSVTLLVALDTGSDLFWVPCDCSNCAETISTGAANNAEVTIYSPKMSLTSQRLPCSNSFCGLESECDKATNLCAYKVAYVSAGTSSSGILVEDILYLRTEDASNGVVKTRVVLGCGQVQTGSFLNAAAPNGLLGLGMEKISIPSILSSSGLTSNSFSMCFGDDGFGRISFGDKGSLDQEETSFDLDQSQNTYNIRISGISVGNSSFLLDFSALVDSGTSFAYLTDPAYTFLTNSFNALVRDEQYIPDSKIPFEYCYHMSSDANNSWVPDFNLSLTTRGGSQFPISDPVIVASIEQNQYVYCLAVIRSSNLNIIGQNFLTGLRVVFDREREILGWKKFNCYNIEDSEPLPVNPQNSSIHPPMQPNRYNPDATKETGNATQVTELSPHLGDSSHLNCFMITTIMLLVILLAIM